MALTERTKRLLTLGENCDVEYKAKVTQDFNEDLVAFANASGGICLFGVRDLRGDSGKHQGEVVGIEISDRTRGQIQSRADSTIDKIPVRIEHEHTDDGRGIYVVRQRNIGSRKRREHVDNSLGKINLPGGSTWMSNRSKGWVGN